MKKRLLASIIAVTVSMMPVPFVMAEDSTEATETAQVTQVAFNQDFGNYTAASSQNSVVETGDANKVLQIKRTDSSTNNTDSIELDTAIEQDIVELEFKLLPRLNSGSSKAEAYLQLMQGSSNARLNIKISADSGDKTKYRIKIGSVVPITADELYHLPQNAADDNGNFISEKFNKIKIVMHRILNEQGTIDNDLSKIYVYLNDTSKGTYTFTEVGAGTTYTAGKTIESVRTYQYSFSESEPPIYFDDISVKGKSNVEYIPSQLSMSFNANMDYEGEPKLIVSGGLDSMYLEQQVRLSLINAENEESVTEVSQADVAKTDDSKASFSFEEVLSVSPGWYYANVDRYIGGEKKGEGRSQKIYVATTEQLTALPGDFASLPENDAEAQAKVEYYLPCFLSEEEINELLPETEGSLTALGAANLKFITDYFKASTEEYTTISQVQADFMKAKGYLELKNAQGQSEVRGVLEEGGYLEDYIENEIFSANENAFFSHFEIKRTDGENPLISDEKVNGALRYAMAMTSINAALRSGVRGVVESYNDIFLLDLSKITNDNADTIYPALYNKGYTSLTTLQEDWNSAIDAIPEEDEEEEEIPLPEEEEKDYSDGSGGKGSSSSGSSGGGGGGGGSVKTDKAEELRPQIEPPEVTETEETVEKQLNDIENHWAENEIKVLYDLKIVTGFEDGSFRPESTLTRAELVTMLIRILPEEENKEEIEFGDVSSADWYYEAVKKAAAAGIVQGADGKFLPNDSITRQQLSVMIFRALKIDAADTAASFSDGKEISDYARSAVSYLYSQGIISGYEDGTFRPENTASRAEAAKLLCGLLDKLAE